MLQPKLILLVTILLTFFAGLAGATFDPLFYRTHVWPYMLIFLGFTFIRHFFFSLGVLLDNRHREKLNEKFHSLDHCEYPMVSILVPAYNEEAMIAQTIAHLANLNYPNYEIIVIDDGSQDQTYACAIAAEKLYPDVKIKVVSRPNGGKAEALNHGLSFASGELILGVDADGRIDPGALAAGAKHFMDSDVASVAGFVEVEGQKTMLESFQQLEYMISLNFLRKAYSILGIVPVVPGPVGMFRREALIEIGGLTRNRQIFAEDAELSMRLIANGWKIRSEQDMVATTEAPSDWLSFFRQRYRWNRGVFQALSANFGPMAFSTQPLARFAAIHLYLEAWALPLINIILIGNFLIRLFAYNEANLFTVWILFAIFLDFWMVVMSSLRNGKFIHSLVYFVLSKLFYDQVLFF